jgi:allantoinase
MSADLYLRNAQVVNEHEIFHGGLVIEGEKILHVVKGVPEIRTDRVIDLDGNLLLPGLVDGHVHFEDPGMREWETFEKATQAAAAGGVTTILDMPVDSTPSTIDASKLKFKLDAIHRDAMVDFGFWGGLVDNNLADLQGMVDLGIVALKAFMVETGVDDFKHINDDVLYAGLLFTRDAGLPLGVHAENDWVTRYLAQKLQNQGRVDRQAWLDSRPPETELEAIQRALFWAKVTGGRLHIVHCTISSGVEAVSNAKSEGVQATVETCPVYLFYDESDFLKLGPVLKSGPPVRSREEVEKLWQQVLAGRVDVIGSDHSPSTWDLKEVGTVDIWKAWGGMSGVQTMLPILLTEGVHKRGLLLPELVRMTSSGPARLFDIYPKKGCLEPGSDADMIIVDLDQKWVLKPEMLLYQNKYSAYDGVEFKGKVIQTILRGKTIYQNGNIVGQPGYGKYLHRGENNN